MKHEIQNFIILQMNNLQFVAILVVEIKSIMKILKVKTYIIIAVNYDVVAGLFITASNNEPPPIGGSICCEPLRGI